MNKKTTWITTIKLLVLLLFVLNNSVNFYGIMDYVYEGLAAMPAMLTVNRILTSVSVPLCFVLAGALFAEEYKAGLGDKAVWGRLGKDLALPLAVTAGLWVLPIRYQFFYPPYEWNSFWWVLKNLALGEDYGHLWILVVMLLAFVAVGLIVEGKKRLPGKSILYDVVLLALFFLCSWLVRNSFYPWVKNYVSHLGWLYLGYILGNYPWPGKLADWKRATVKSRIVAAIEERSFFIFLLHLPLTHITLHYGIRWNPWLFMSVNLIVWGSLAWYLAGVLKRKTPVKQAECLFFAMNLFLLAQLSVNVLGQDLQNLLLGLLFAVVVEWVLLKKCTLDVTGAVLLGGMFFYGKVVSEASDWRIQVALIPAFLYLIGKTFTQARRGADQEKRARGIVLLVSVALCLEGILNAWVWYENGYSAGRNWLAFWTGNDLPATQHVFYGVPMVGLFFYGFWILCKKKWYGLAVMAAAIWTVYFSLITKSRITLLVFGLVFAANLLLFVWLNRKNKYVRIGFPIAAVMVIIVVAVLVGGYVGEWELLKRILPDSVWGRGGGILNNVRFKAQRQVLEQLFIYPDGGRRMEIGLSHAHNVWLDVAYVAGLLPFLLFAGYTLLTIKDVILLILHNEISQETKYLLVSVYSALFFYYTVETALEAHFMYWAIGCLVSGVIRGALPVKRKNKGRRKKKKAVRRRAVRR